MVLMDFWWLLWPALLGEFFVGFFSSESSLHKSWLPDPARNFQIKDCVWPWEISYLRARSSSLYMRLQYQLGNSVNFLTWVRIWPTYRTQQLKESLVTKCTRHTSPSLKGLTSWIWKKKYGSSISRSWAKNIKNHKNASSLNKKGLPPSHLESWVYYNSFKSFIIWIWQVLTLCCELRTLTADSSQTRQLTALGLTQFTPTLLKGFMSVQRLQMRERFEKASKCWTLTSTHTRGEKNNFIILHWASVQKTHLGSLEHIWIDLSVLLNFVFSMLTSQILRFVFSEQ